jgi:Arc/MetJ-type ribon-helix-helix transcriptional regulator
MPGQRSPGQKLINLSAKESFIDFVDSKLGRLGYTDRSQFIRDSIREKIAHTLKIDVPEEMALPPSRRGIGGRPISSKPSSVLRAHVARAARKASGDPAK